MLVNMYGDKNVDGVVFDKWYPPIEPDVPRVYQEDLSDEFKERMYTKEAMKWDRAWLYGNPDAYRVHNYEGAKVELVMDPVKAELFPGSNKENNIPYKVSVKNVCDKPVYVRVHIAIPKCLDDNIPDFNASLNLLHFNAEKEVSLGPDAWNWSSEQSGRQPGSFIGSAGWFCEYQTIDGIEFNIYKATYEIALQPGATTPTVIFQAYLDANADAEKLMLVNDIMKTNKWELKVAVEAIYVDESIETDPFKIFNTCSDPETGRDLFNTDYTTKYTVTITGTGQDAQGGIPNPPPIPGFDTGSLTPPSSPVSDDPADEF